MNFKNQKKKLMLFAFVLFFLFGLSQHSEKAYALYPDNWCGYEVDENENITGFLTYTIEDGVLYITGKGELFGWYDTKLIPWYSERANIKKVVIGPGCTGIGHWSFYNLFNIESIYISEGVKYINAEAFRNCKRMTYIDIPDSCTHIGERAFYKCTALERVAFGRGMTMLRTRYGSDEEVTNGYRVFDSCPNINFVLAFKGNGQLLQNKRLFDEDLRIKTLSYNGTVADFLEDVGSHIFTINMATVERIVCLDGQADLSTCTLRNTTDFKLTGDGVMSFKHQLLNKLENYPDWLPLVKVLNLRHSVEEIPDNVMAGLVNLQEVYFEGTQEEWDKVTIGSGNENLTNAVIHCHTHTYGEYIVYNPGCTRQGYKTRVCTECKRSDPEIIYIPPLNHSDRTETIIQESTCGTHGIKKIYCNNCWLTWEEELPLDPDNHRSQKSYRQEPTCWLPGFYGLCCAECEGEIVIQGPLYKMHDYEKVGTFTDGSDRMVCKTCEYEEYKDDEINNVFVNSDLLTGKLKVTIWGADHDIQVCLSTDNGKSWTPTGTIARGKSSILLTVDANKTYKVKCRYKVSYKVDGKTKTGYGPYSPVGSVKMPARVSITSLTNTSSNQEIVFSALPKSVGGKNVTYYVVTDNGSGKFSEERSDWYNASGSTSFYTYHSLANGKKYSYKVYCSYTDSKGNTYESTSPTKSYYYLTWTNLTYYKNTSAGAIKLTWKKNSKASGYQVKYVTGTTTKTVTISGSSNTSKTLTKLTKGKTYKINVRAYKTVSGKKYYSAWSNTKSVKVSK